MDDSIKTWYRQTIRSRLRETNPGPEAEAFIREFDARIDTAGSSQLPVELRRRIEDLGLDRLDATSDARRPGATLARRLIRTAFGVKPHLCRPQADVKSTRVLHAIADLQIGGAQQLVFDLTNSASGSSIHQVIARSIGIRFNPSVPHSEIRGNVDRMRRAFDRFKPELVHVCHYHAGLAIRAWYQKVFEIALERDLPIVQSHCVIGDPWLGGVQQHLVFCSDWSRACSQVPEIPDSVISPGSPFERFRAPRRTLGSNPLIGMVYRLAGDKIDGSVLPLLTSMLRGIPQAHLQVVGDGPIRSVLSRGLEDAGLASRVTWTGFVPFKRLPELHRGFDLAIAPVLADTFGSGAVHSIISGTPVIGYGVAAIPSILRREEAIVTPGDTKEYVEKISAVLNDDHLHASIHETQRLHAEAHFQVEQMNRRYHDLFRRVADEHSAADST